MSLDATVETQSTIETPEQAPQSKPVQTENTQKKAATKQPWWTEVNYGNFNLPAYAYLIERPATEEGLALNTLTLFNHDNLPPDRRPHPELLWLEDAKKPTRWNRAPRFWEDGKDQLVDAIKKARDLRARVASFLPDEDQREAERDWEKRCQSAATVSNAAFFIENTPAIRVTSSEFNRKSYLLGMPGGKVLDTREGLVRDAKPDDRITLESGLIPPTEPISDARMYQSRIYRAFNEWSLKRPHLRDWMLALLGYLLVAGNPLKIVVWLYGQAGNDGKSLFGWLLHKMLGEYWIGMSWMSLDADRREERTNDLRRLDNKRIFQINETSKRHGVNVALLKNLSGDTDQLTGRYHNQEFVDFAVTGIPVFTINQFPKATGADRAFWNRQRIIPFDATFPEDDSIKAEIEAEIESGMGLKIALHGLRLYKEGILDRSKIPDEMKDALTKWMERDDPNADLMEFFDEACEKWDTVKEPDPDKWKERLDAVHTAYCGYKSGRREYPQGIKNFREALEAAGVLVKKSTGNRYYVYGYKLKPEAQTWGR